MAFVIGLFLCFFFYAAFDFLAELEAFGAWRNFVLKLGINEHYRSISEGVVDTRDIVYFLSFIAIMLFLSKLILTNRKQ